MWNKGDKVVVKGLDMAFIFDRYINNNTVQLFIEGETRDRRYHIIFARPDALLPNNTDTFISEGWNEMAHTILGDGTRSTDHSG